MGTPDNSLLNLIKAWIPRRSKPDDVSRDYWMPDRSCRVCYECDSPFTILNRRHHCRLCGLIFCGKCTNNFIPVLSCSTKNVRAEPERIRVCNFCFKEKGSAQNRQFSDCISLSLSTMSFASMKSSGTGNSCSVNAGSASCVTGPYRSCGSNASLGQFAQMESELDKQETGIRGRDMDFVPNDGESSNQFSFRTDRSYDDDEESGTSCSDSDAQQFNHPDIYYGPLEFSEAVQGNQPYNMHSVEENNDAKEICSPLHDNTESLDSLDADKMTDEAGLGNNYDDHTSSIYSMETADSEPVDFENNGLLWLPPEPEDEDDEIEIGLLAEDEDADLTAESGYCCSSNSIGSGEYRSRDQTSEGHKKAMKNVVDGHFRALIAQLLQVENLSTGEEGEKGTWLEIITCLSWEAATLLKPDTSKGGGMDPGGYVKVKCIASGHRSQCMVIKGVVCKKNVAHRRMVSKIEKPHFLILGGALEYQRVTNSLSSFDTLLQQEVDHLKMAVAKIAAYHPHVLLVEKSVSRFAQEHLLAKNISLVLNMKRPLLERIARCTGAQIVPSIDHLSSQKLGSCDLFHVEKFLEEHGSAGERGKKMRKTLMFFEGCPKPLGCTVLLKGASVDELKKVKHVIQYGVFAAYHLALETSFLADEGASLPDLPLMAPITVALPDKPSNFNESVYKVTGYEALRTKPQLTIDVQRPNTFIPIFTSASSGKVEATPSPSSYCIESHSSQLAVASTCSTPVGTKKSPVVKRDRASASNYSQLPSPSRPTREKNKVCFGGTWEAEISRKDQTVKHEAAAPTICNNSLEISEGNGVIGNHIQTQNTDMIGKQHSPSDLADTQQGNGQKNEHTLAKEGFPPDNQSILVSHSRRCVWKGTVCDRSRIFRIKYYGGVDKPLGRFLRDDLFDQSNLCRTCEMTSEGHVHCYTHHQGSLIISVRKLLEFLLPGEEDGKIWMWHRCLKCPRSHGFPPATRRVVMSDAAWGLSLGKFLELSFSNHAAASRVASCGHSLHRDCLRFYGFGRMVACFRYASIDVHSVFMPPHKLDFNYEQQEWIQKEATEVADRTELLFTEVFNALQQISEGKRNSSLLNGNLKCPESREHTLELEGMLQKEKLEFKESLQKLLNKEVSQGHPVIDILEVNKLRRQLLFQSYLWDQRLIFAAGLGSTTQEMPCASLTRDKEKPCLVEKVADPNLVLMSQNSFSGFDSLSLGSRIDEPPQGGISFSHQEGVSDHPDSSNIGQQQIHIELDSFQGKQNKTFICTSTSASDKLEPLEYGLVARRTLSDGQFPLLSNLSKTFDAKWTGGENSPIHADVSMSDSSASIEATAAMSVSEDSEERNGSEVTQSFGSALLTKLGDSAEDFSSWIGMPFLNIYRSMNKNLGISPRFDALNEYHPIYVSLFRELERLGGARLLLPIGLDETVIPIYDDEPTSIISYALVSPDYHMQMSDEQERFKESSDSSILLTSKDMPSFQLYQPNDDMFLDPNESFGSNEDGILSMSGSRSNLGLDPLTPTKSMHARVTFSDDGPLGKVNYTVTCYYAKHFDALRRKCCPSELDFIRSLSRCKKWGAQGGKSKVFFAKSLDDRFIIKQVTKTELESFITFAPEYFKYLSYNIGTGSPTCLAKILGIYQVTSKQLKGGKELKMDVLVMENLLFRRSVTRLYDLKGSLRSRYNPDSNGNNKVLLDQNLIEAMPTSPIFVGNKAKRLLERAVWNDTHFLGTIDVMDYSLLVGVDEEKHELVIGIIDFMRQYTWDKHLETWVKTSGILGGPKNVSPTVISPKQYKKRFRKAMSAYFIVVPDQWSLPSSVPAELQADPSEDKRQSTPDES